MNSIQNKKTGNLIKLIVGIIMILALIQTVNALGVAPAREVVNYEPGQKKEIRLIIINNEHKELKLAMYAKGEFKDNVKIKNHIINIKPEEEQTTIYYEIELPDKIETPGSHQTEIMVMELPDNGDGTIIVAEDTIIYQSKNKESVATAAEAVIQQLIIQVPYPGVYAEGKLFVSAAQAGEPTAFTISMYNFGEQKIQNAKAKIQILGPTNEEIATVYSTEIGLEPRTEGKLNALWDAKVNPGSYHAFVTVNYDDKQFNLEQNFYIGNLRVDINDISAKDFKLGDIAKFQIDLESKWNDKISGVYAEMKVLDSKGVEQTSFKTEQVEMKPNGKETLYGYWDTKGANVGEYDVNVIVHYAGKTTEKLYEIVVGIDNIQTKYAAPTGQVLGGNATGTEKRDSILIILVVILVAINLGWFVFFKLKKKTG